MSFQAFSAAGRFYRGNLHTHSTLSDGTLPPEAVCAHYREAGYDFLALTDHFQRRYGFPVADTKPSAPTSSPPSPARSCMPRQTRRARSGTSSPSVCRRISRRPEKAETGPELARRAVDGRRLRRDRASAMVEPDDRGRARAADGACGGDLQSRLRARMRPRRRRLAARRAAERGARLYRHRHRRRAFPL